MRIFNTKSRSVEVFEPLNPPKVTFYSCGPTVYDNAHIGHARKYVVDDILKRTLMYFGYEVTHVMNITDVGHLESDADEGEDKLEKGAKKYDKTVQEVVDMFTKQFFETTDALHILRPQITPKATEHIPEMIELIQKLIEKGHAYETDTAVYFDITTFPEYGALSGQKVEDKLVNVRDEVHSDPQKKHPADFALWFKRIQHHEKHSMHWDSPWGDGFPGWHIECSAMSMKYLGDTIDIHSGGLDHIPVHHENEIAQSECATGKQFVKYWVHSQFLTVHGEKMSKSLGNLYTIADLIEKNFDPIALRYLILQTHYRQPINFTWESLQAAQTALTKLRNSVVQLRAQNQRQQLSEEKQSDIQKFSNAIQAAFENDLNTAQAIATIWEIVKSNIPSEDKYDLIVEADRILGLDLAESEKYIEKSYIGGIRTK